ncbi:glycerophosphodiester phosphodiesterase [Brachybacterium endophyticum]|uniref:Glycerophosphodiester phosphodiesterase n=1 Tax=Brachybacterium endophyticum TaxID=2182385 RepID=A0A2U2RH19_9MICO|nr:glycerophosphodiester phosphodiesterase [Brachybacterium endophyticum]PWH05157.1 glycerophosphodiester phosphodiesterase [Brachybacterium endophyticum]
MDGPSSPWSAPGGVDPSPGPQAPGPRAYPTAEGPAPLQRELVRRPGLFPLRPLALGEIFGAGVGIYRRRPKLVFGLSALVFGVAFVLTSVVGGIGMAPTAVQLQSIAQSPETASGGGPAETFGGSLGQILGTVGSSLATSLITLVAMQLVLVVLTRLTLTEATGREASDAQLRASLRSHGWRAVLTGLLNSLLTFVPFLLISLLGAVPLAIVQAPRWYTIAPVFLFLLLGLLAALWVWGRVLFATPILVTEDTGPIGAVRRSFVLTRGRRLWRPLGIALLLTVCQIIAQQAVAGVFGVIATGIYIAVLLASQGQALVIGMIVMLVLSFLGTFAATVVVAPFWAAGLTALYADLRMRHESWDIELRRAQFEASGGDDAGIAR